MAEKKAKPPKPNELNGDTFTTPGGMFIYEKVFDLAKDVGYLKGMMALIVIALGVLIARAFEAI